MEPTKKDWTKWANHKSGKDKWIEKHGTQGNDEREDEDENYLTK